MPILCRLSLFFLFLPAFIYAQDKNNGELDSLAEKLVGKIRAGLKEKVFFQTDKRIYSTGERVLFKTFVTDSLSSKITNQSKILFVDLIDERDAIKARVILNAGRFQTDGAMVLSDSLDQGYYWLRAYTHKMMNEGRFDISLQPFFVINEKNKSVATIKNDGPSAITSATKPIIEIYPEGGSLISGTNSTVAIKVADQNGNPLVVNGLVKDGRDTIVARFSTNKAGLSQFNFYPKWFSRYKVFIQNNDRYDSIAVLPRINLYATQLSVVKQNDQIIKVRVMLEDSIYSPDYKTYLMGISKDSLCFAGVGMGMYELNISVANFPGGVASLLLFNTQKQLVSERNIYIDKKDVVVNISTGSQTYLARENVRLNIDVADAAGRPLPATLAVSVVDSRIADTTNYFYNEPYKNYLPLDADLHMLAQNGRVKNLMEVKNVKNISSIIMEDPFAITGIVTDRKKQALQNKEVVLMSGEGAAFFIQDTTDAKGRFTFHLPDHDDSTKFTLQVNSLTGEKQEFAILMDPLALQDDKKPFAIKQKFVVGQLPNENRKIQYYRDTIVPGLQKHWLLPATVITNVKNKTNSNTITQEMLKSGGYNNVGQAVLRSGKMHLVGGYLMAGGPNRFGPSATDEPNVIVDGVQVPLPAGDPSEVSPVLAYLKNLSTNEIEYIKVLTNAEGGGYGVRGGHGIIEIVTTSKSTNVVTGVPLKTIYPQGFHVPPVFEMPDYTIRQIKNSKNADVRSTLYWNGDIVTDNNGKATCDFFTADMPASYVVTIAGISINGDRIYKTATIIVK